METVSQGLCFLPNWHNRKLLFISGVDENGEIIKKKIQHVESFYLRAGAIAFGVGTMVYSGLELGHYFEHLKVFDDSESRNVRNFRF
jgi:hypothetical protein